MTRSFIVENSCDIDFDVYEVYPRDSVFSYFVHCEVDILPDDFITVSFEPFSALVLKIIRNEVVFYVHP